MAYNATKPIQLADKREFIQKGMKLKIIEDCFDESYLHELTYYYQKSLKEKKLKKGDIVEVLEYWTNLYGSYIRCTFNGNIFDIKPKYLTTNLN